MVVPAFIESRSFGRGVVKDGSKDSPFKLPTLSPKEGLETFNASLSSGRRSTASWVSLSFVVSGPSPPESFQAKFEKDPRRKPQVVANTIAAAQWPHAVGHGACNAEQSNRTAWSLWHCVDARTTSVATARHQPARARFARCGRPRCGDQAAGTSSDDQSFDRKVEFLGGLLNRWSHNNAHLF